MEFKRNSLFILYSVGIMTHQVGILSPTALYCKVDVQICEAHLT